MVQLLAYLSTWQNQAGLLSSVNQEQLFRNPVQSGLANMSGDELCGCTVSACSGDGPRDAHMRSAFPGAAAHIGTPGFQLSPTTGAIHVLSFSEFLQLAQEYYAPGSLGSFILQLAVRVQKQSITVRGRKIQRACHHPNKLGRLRERARYSVYLLIVPHQTRRVGLLTAAILLQIRDSQNGRRRFPG